MANDIEAKLEALKREVEGLKGKAVTVTETIANPAPLGLAGFGLTTLLLNVVNAKIINMSDIGMVLPVGLFYGGLAQLLAGMWEFKKNNTFGATAFTSFGAFWLAFAVMKILQMNGDSSCHVGGRRDHGVPGWMGNLHDLHVRRYDEDIRVADGRVRIAGHPVLSSGPG